MKLTSLLESEQHLGLNLKQIALEIQQKLLDRADEMPGLEFGKLMPIHDSNGKLICVKLTIMPAPWTGKKSATVRKRNTYSCRPQAIEVYDGPAIRLERKFFTNGLRSGGKMTLGPGLYYSSPDNHRDESVIYEAFKAPKSDDEVSNEMIGPLVAGTGDLNHDQIDPFIEEFVNGWDTGQTS